MEIAILVLGLTLAAVVISRLLFPVEAAAHNIPGRERRAGFGEVGPFHAVSIQPAEGCCAAVKSIAVQRFLSEEAPGLPLTDCGSTDCRCRYVHHEDRRSGARDRRLQAAEHPDEIEFWSQRDRRGSGGRRQSDLVSA